MNIEALNTTRQNSFPGCLKHLLHVLKQTDLLVVNHNHLRNDLFLLCFCSNQHLRGASIKVILVIFDFKSQVRGQTFLMKRPIALGINCPPKHKIIYL